MKAIVMAMALVLSAASAKAATTSELMALVIENASSLKVTSTGSGQISNKEFISLLASFLVTDKTTKTTTDSQCEVERSSRHRVGARVETCVMSLNNADTDGGTESSLMIKMKISTPVVPNAKPSLVEKSINVDLAG